MTFATEAQKSASERFMLVRLTPRKFIGTGTSIGGNQYTFTVSSTINVSNVTVNNVTEPVFTHVGNVLTVTSTTNLASSSNIVTIDHEIYLTGTVNRITSGVSGLPNAEWQPLITSYPQFSQSMRNIADGVFSLSNSDIELISVDRWGQSLLGENDSLSKAPISVWVCIDTLETNRKIFDGEVSQVSYSYGKISLSIIDTFSKLKDSSSFGTYANSHAYVGNPNFTCYPNPDDENKAIPITIGRSSPFSIADGWRHLDICGNPSGRLFYLNKGQQAIKIAPQTPKAADTITFLLGRIVASDLKKLNFGTISAAYALYVEKQISGASNDPSGESGLILFEKIIYLTCSTFNGEIGDYIPQVGGWISGIGSLFGGHNVAISCPVFGFSQSDSGNFTNPSGSISVPSIPNNTIPSVSMWIDGGDSVAYQAHYWPLALVPSGSTRQHSTRYLKFSTSIQSAGTIGGEPIVHVFATVSPSANNLNDSDGANQLATAVVRCRMSPNSTKTHANALKFVVKSSGMTTNDSTFTTADSDLSANVSMTIPRNESREFGSYLEVAQSITSSTLGILRVNEDRQVEYEILKNPNSMSTDGTRDNVNMISGDTSAKVEYQDCYSTVKFNNPQLNDIDAINGGGSNALVELPKNKQLHRVDKVKTVEHVLDSIQNRKTAIAGYFGAPTVEYSLSTASEDLASRIGDVIEINNTATADDSEVVKGIITGLDQQGAKTNVKINEIRGVP